MTQINTTDSSKLNKQYRVSGYFFVAIAAYVIFVMGWMFFLYIAKTPPIINSADYASSSGNESVLASTKSPTQVAGDSQALVSMPVQVPITPTLTPMPMPVRQVSIPSFVSRHGGTLLGNPAGKPLQTLEIGQRLDISGRSSDNRWFFVATNGIKEGWIAVDSVVIGDKDRVSQLPISTKEVVIAPSIPAGNFDTVNEKHMVQVKQTAIPYLNIRSGPGTDYPSVSHVEQNVMLRAIARNDKSDWIQVARPDIVGGLGWVSTQYVNVTFSVSELPLSSR